MNVLEKILEEIENLNYYPEGMGCGIEDCGITDRYEACEYGWNQAIEAVVEVINNMNDGKGINVLSKKNEIEKIAIAAGAEDMIKSNVSKNIVLHQGKRMDNGKEITGFLTKMFGQYHIVLEEDENTAYPVEKDSIRPCLKGTGLVEKSWNRWYVNENMLPRLQDTVLICKGWYNKEKYHTEYEALRAYWAAIAEVSVKDIGYAAVLQCLLLPACEAFLCNRKFCELFYERIYKLDIVMREFEKIKKHKNKAEYREMNAEYLIEILTDALFALRNDEYSSKKRPEDGYCVV